LPSRPSIGQWSLRSRPQREKKQPPPRKQKSLACLGMTARPEARRSVVELRTECLRLQCVVALWMRLFVGSLDRPEDSPKQHAYLTSIVSSRGSLSVQSCLSPAAPRRFARCLCRNVMAASLTSRSVRVD
jgi:hypothetical protein